MSPDPGRRQAVEEALLAWRARASGTAPDAPAPLTECIREVLQVAGSRLPSTTAPQARAAAVRRAACEFVRVHLLQPTGSYYALLGLPRTAEPELVKERYRQMMRLMHPDFADASGIQWPADAAARVNQAYEVLGSVEKRKHYDQSLGGRSPPKPARAEKHSIVPHVPVLIRRPKSKSRAMLPRLAAGFGVAGALGAMALLFAGTGERGTLVTTAEGGAPARAARTAIAASETLRGESAAHEPGLSPMSAAAETLAAILPGPLRIAPAETASSTAVRTLPQPALANPPPATAIVTDGAPVVQPIAVADIAPAAQALPTPARTVPSVAVAVAPPAPAAVPALPPPNAGVTLAEVHPLLTELLQQIESGRPERVIGQLDRETRRAAAAQALVRQYASLLGSERNVHVADAHFSSHPREGVLVVKGRVVLQVGGSGAPAQNKELALLAEFVSRDGSVVLTRLAPAQPEVAQ